MATNNRNENIHELLAERDALQAEVEALRAKVAELEEVNEALEEIDETSVVEQHDNMNCQCEKCKKGSYIETSMYSDLEGWLECSHCSHRVDRYVPYKK